MGSALILFMMGILMAKDDMEVIIKRRPAGALLLNDRAEKVYHPTVLFLIMSFKAMFRSCGQTT